jgi:Holliday junction resolvasome RuvABC endonuclease subunit
MRLMTIDPGLQGTGVVVWHRTKPIPVKVWVLTSPRRDMQLPWWDRALNLTADIASIAAEWRVTLVAIEMTEYMAAAHRVMAWKTGDLQRLTFTIGAISATVDANVQLYRTSEWKGQLPKKIVVDRCTARLGKARCERLGIKTHAWDAVGIGLFHLTGSV